MKNQFFLLNKCLCRAPWDLGTSFESNVSLRRLPDCGWPQHSLIRIPETLEMLICFKNILLRTPEAGTEPCRAGGITVTPMSSVAWQVVEGSTLDGLFWHPLQASERDSAREDGFTYDHTEKGHGSLPGPIFALGASLSSGKREACYSQGRHQLHKMPRTPG